MFTLDKTRVTEKRFSQARFLEWSQSLQVYDPSTSLFVLQIRKLPLADIIEHKNPNARWDLASYAIYGDTQFFWHLFFYNDYQRFYDLKKGMSVKYPSLKSIEQLVNSLDVKSNQFI